MNKTRLTSAVSSKSQTVLPKEVRERLRITRGDRLRYVIADDGIRIEKDIPDTADDPFAVFHEWLGEEDEAAFAAL
jgi:antitoxin PrlF